MIGLGTLALALIIQPSNFASIEGVENRNFQVLGWRCVGADCDPTPHRRLHEPLHFADWPSKQAIDRAKHLKADWSVILNCAVSRGQLRSCKVDDHDSESQGVEISLKLAGALKLAADEPKSGRAIIMVNYETSGCPTWFCVHEGPPVPVTVR